MRAVLSVCAVAVGLVGAQTTPRRDTSPGTLLTNAPSVSPSPLGNVQLSNIDNVNPPSFETTSTTVSFFMRCTNQNGVCFRSNLNNLGAGIFNRETFVTNLISAANAVAMRERIRATGRSDAGSEAFTLAATNVVFNRVVERTSPFTPVTVQSFTQSNLGVLGISGTPTVDPTSWNVFVRFTVSDLAVEVADALRMVVAELQVVYGSNADILTDSLWIEREARFLPDRFGVVPGRGHKEHILLVPLFIGLFSMLAVPALLSWIAVQYARKNKVSEKRIRRRERHIEELNDDLVTKKAAVEQLRQTAEQQAEDEDRVAEGKRLRDGAELTHPDVDWSAKPPAQVPY